MGEFLQDVVRQSGGGSDFMSTLIMMGAMFAIFYFILIRPQRKKQMEHQSLLSSLKKGDDVVLTSGIFARIKTVDTQFLSVEIADRTVVKVLKEAVSGLAKKQGNEAASDKPQDASKGKDAKGKDSKNKGENK
jgi:preprotein translocase subunit YajC